MNYTNLNSNINIYFSEIKKNASLTPDVERELFTRVAMGDERAKSDIFNRTAKLAVAVAKTYTCNADLLEDLIQEANLGILRAIDKFDLSLGYRFSSYARFWMKAQISEFLDEMGVVSGGLNSRVTAKIRKISDEYYKTNHRDINEYELMDALEEMGEVVNDVTVLMTNKVTHIDQSLDEDGEFTVGDTKDFNDATASTNGFEMEIANEALSSDMAELLNILDERSRRLVKLFFGIGCDYAMDYKAIAEKEGLTQERVRQIVVTALKTMKK